MKMLITFEQTFLQPHCLQGSPETPKIQDKTYPL